MQLNNTHISHKTDKIELYRIIGSRLYTIILPDTISSIKLIKYIELTDDNFRKLSTYVKEALRNKFV